MKRHTQVKSLLNVHFVANVSLHRVSVLIMKRLTHMRNFQGALTVEEFLCIVGEGY